MATIAKRASPPRSSTPSRSEGFQWIGAVLELRVDRPALKNDLYVFVALDTNEPEADIRGSEIAIGRVEVPLEEPTVRPLDST